MPRTPVTQAGGRVRLDFVDGLRALAVLAVFALHIRAFWDAGAGADGGLGFVIDRIAAQGAAGVDLFIVLSGFCMTYPLVRGRQGVAAISAVRFYRRRAVRLLPAYYLALVLVISLLLMPALQHRMVGRPIDGWDVLAHLFLVQPFSPETLSSINGPLWSISLEMTLYAVFPLLLMVLSRWGWGVLLAGAWSVAGAWLIAVDGIGAGTGWGSVMQFWLPGHLFEFVMGMLAANLLCYPRKQQTRYALVVLPVAALIGAAGTILAVPIVRTFGWGLAAFCLTVAASAWQGRPRSVARFGVQVGLVSYSFYLLHQPFILLTAPLVKGLGADPVTVYLLLGPLGAAIMYGLARVFFALAERPFLVAGSMRDAIKASPSVGPVELAEQQTDQSVVLP